MSRFLAAPILVLLAVTAFASDPSKELDNSAVVIRNMTASHQILSLIHIWSRSGRVRTQAPLSAT